MIMERCSSSCPTTNASQTARFAGNLLHWRLKRELSQTQAADKLGVAKSTWSQWEAGKRTPSILYLPLLGQGFFVCLVYSGPGAFGRFELKSRERVGVPEGFLLGAGGSVRWPPDGPGESAPERQLR